MKCYQCQSETSNPKFCSRSCSASYNNALKAKRQRAFKEIVCPTCSKTVYISKQAKFCSRECYLLKSKEKFINGELSCPRTMKKYVTERDGDQCSICKIVDWMGKPLIMILDHIDGNPTNNLSTNLRLVCSNCDSQLDTYKAKNKGSGRAYRRKSRR